MHSSSLRSPSRTANIHNRPCNKIPVQKKYLYKKNIFIKTFGCQMNEYDSEKILTLLQNDYCCVSDYKLADLIIVNTCSVREKAEKKLYDFLGRLAKLKKAGHRFIIGVAGCVAQQEGEKILKRCRAVNFVVGTHNISLIPTLVREAENNAKPCAVVNHRNGWESEVPDEMCRTPLGSYIDFSNTITINHAFGNYYSLVRALIAIQRGCNKHCSYCVVPTTRGVEISRSPNEIIKEIQFKVHNGASEVMLLGQTVNSYGKDLSPKISFEDLVRQIAEIEHISRIRFMSPHPQDVTKDFIKLYKEIPQLCPSIHLPLQSGNNRILKLMNRNYKVERYLEIVEMLREARSDIAITSDFIVAFPTETEDEFEQTLDIMKQVKYCFSFSFKYSHRPNTTAKTNFFGSADEVNNAVASNRLSRLQELQKELSLAYNSQFVGKSTSVLLEVVNLQTNTLRGRNPYGLLVEAVGDSTMANLKQGSEVDVLVEGYSPVILKGSV